jgi:hypothetical protein
MVSAQEWRLAVVVMLLMHVEEKVVIHSLFKLTMASTVKYLSVDLSALANTLLNSAGSLNRTCGGNLAETICPREL